MSEDTSSSQRRRGDTLEKALFDATWVELVSVGYRKLSLDAVALRAGTSKAVLYRRWGSRQELVIAALKVRDPQLPGLAPDTGSLRDDVLGIFGHIHNDLNALPLDIGLGLLSDTANNPKLHEFYLRRIKQASVKLMIPILERAEKRGEITTAALSERIITLPIDLMRHEVMVTGKSASRAAIIQIVDDVYLPLLKSLG